MQEQQIRLYFQFRVSYHKSTNGQKNWDIQIKTDFS